ncbi:MAG: hypothetical protein JWP28_1922 [Phenylobacterium sp.]|jgi:uncharacterized protein with PIN domain|uniref:DUF5615 family PIN-like protein n=1 Tax=Phenylobacterium sp. TaxID=1871053 RepID=UPI0026226DEC|nr:DUF5615 family PIN-like protein [Phenylobacterium sp.]MDB5450731.1 hypothetical protein [Phenylobacterium sp.]MDB5497891.1 hypothetical protein [Phenylobacterium sp.]
MRFLCDEMLARLARLLRAAGYDTYLARGGQADDDLLRIARAEDRILLTRDRRLAERAWPASLLVGGRGATAEAQDLAAALPIDWTHAPFTRCVMDNTLLDDAGLQDVARMPPQARVLPGPFRVCPACGRLYWPGSHVRRMSNRLQALAQILPQP